MVSILTHWLQLGDEFLLGPLLLLAPERHRVGHQHLVVVGVGHIQVVHKHDVGVLDKDILQWKYCEF